jgi:hypothetical protein
MADDHNEGLRQDNSYSFLGVPEIKARFAKLNGKLLIQKSTLY